MTAREKYIQKLLLKDPKKLTRDEKYYLNWTGATGPGAQLRAMLKAEAK